MEMEDTNPKMMMKLPRFGALPEMSVDLSKTKHAESRLVEAQSVNAATYANLEYIFNEAYRELRTAYATVCYRHSKAEEEIENVKAGLLLDSYQDFVKDKPKNFDNADMRKSFVQRNPEHQKAVDVRDQLKAIEVLLETRIKTMERTCAYMKKQMELLMRSGRTGF